MRDLYPEQGIMVVGNGRRVRIRPLKGRYPKHPGRPYCFKTQEYSAKSAVCKNCRHSKECGEPKEVV